MKLLSLIKKAFFVLFLIVVLSFIALFTCDEIVENSSTSVRYSALEKVPKHKVGLLLGTSKYLRSGNINPYYQYRLNAAIELYKNGKIEYLLVSGDNGSVNYDEPTAFKEDLINAGIPLERIYLDYAGFRTFDSIVRAKEIFGQKTLLIISQGFHNARAIYIARHYGMQVDAYDAKDLVGQKGMKVQIREKFARVKLMIDLLTNKKPKFLGEKVDMPT